MLVLQRLVIHTFHCGLIQSKRNINYGLENIFNKSKYFLVPDKTIHLHFFYEGGGGKFQNILGQNKQKTRHCKIGQTSVCPVLLFLCPKSVLLPHLHMHLPSFQFLGSKGRVFRAGESRDKVGWAAYINTFAVKVVGTNFKMHRINVIRR